MRSIHWLPSQDLTAATPLSLRTLHVFVRLEWIRSHGKYHAGRHVALASVFHGAQIRPVLHLDVDMLPRRPGLSTTFLNFDLLEHSFAEVGTQQRTVFGYV